MAKYYCTREIFTSGGNINKWNIPHPDRVDGSSNQIHLGEEIEAGIATKTLICSCGIDCDDDQCTIQFTEELTSGEEAALTTIINNHKNNV